MGILRNPNRQLITVGVIAVAAVALSMLNHWEMTPEAWGYWFFARILSETGTFIVPDRSPFYTLYLNLFMWMGYPTAVTAQYLVSGTLVVVALIALFRRYLGLKTAVFAALLWIPYLLQFAEPPVQMLSLAAMSLAVVARRAGNSRLAQATSYALLIMATLLRATCIVVIVVFAVWDIIQILRSKGLRSVPQAIRPRRADWPVGVLLVLFVWFAAMQSPHPWNNVWTSTVTWAPTNGKSLVDAAFIQNFNVAYIARQYGSFEGKDHYFTNREIFGDANTMLGAMRANPRYVAEQVAANFVRLPGALVQITEFSTVLAWVRGDPEGVATRIALGLIYVGLTLGILYGAWRATAGDGSIRIFLAACVFLTGITALSYVKVRWMYPMIPVLVFSAHWYAGVVRRWLDGGAAAFSKRDKKGRRWVVASAEVLLPLLFLVLLSNGASSWAGVVRSAASDLRNGEIHVLEQRGSTSMKASIAHWRPLIAGCRGVMTLENTFVGAFAGLPVERVYDVWEIPPFGRLGSPGYAGLKPERIDCVLVSHALATETGGGSNMKIRYENYLRPYLEQLQKQGAVTYDIPHFGQAIVLRPSLQKGNH